MKIEELKIGIYSFFYKRDKFYIFKLSIEKSDEAIIFFLPMKRDTDDHLELVYLCLSLLCRKTVNISEEERAESHIEWSVKRRAHDTLITVHPCFQGTDCPPLQVGQSFLGPRATTFSTLQNYVTDYEAKKKKETKTFATQKEEINEKEYRNRKKITEIKKRKRTKIKKEKERAKN